MNRGIQESIESKSGDLEVLCHRYGVAKLSVFGSALGAGFGAESDLDLLVEFLPGRIPGFAFVRLQRELSDLLGRDVDLHTHRSLSRYFRDDVARESRPIFELDEARV